MKKNHLSFKNDVTPLLQLAIPLIVTGFVQSGIWFFETIFLARLGADTLAAGSLVSWLFGTVAVILFGTLSSINILVAHKYGEKDQESIAIIARDGILLAILLAIPSVILFWNMSPIFRLFGQSETIVTLAEAYLRALAWGLPASFLEVAFMEVIIGIGKTRVIFIFSIISVSLNILFSYILIFGKFGFKAYGIAGAGWGTTVSYILTLCIVVFFIFAHKTYRPYFRYIFSLVKPVFLWELLEIGFPLGIMFCVEVAFFFALTLFMGLFGSQIQAANQVALQYLGLFISAIFAIAQAITVRMGHLLGAKEIYSAEKASYIGIFTAVLFMCIVAIFYWIFPTKLISIDFDVHSPANFAIINEIKMLLGMCAVFQIFEAARISLFGSLRSLKDTKFTLLTSILGFWVISAPLGYLLAVHLNFGGVGFWWAMVLGAAISVVVLQWRFKIKIARYEKMA